MKTELYKMLKRDAHLCLACAALLLPPLASLAQTRRPSPQVPALSTLQLIPSNAVPAFGSFHRLTRLDWPPLPYDNVPGCPVYWLGDNRYLIDDTAYDYAARDEQAQMEAAARAALRSLGLDGPIPMDDPQPLGMAYTTNDLWLEVTGATSAALTLTVHPREIGGDDPAGAGGVFDLFCTRELSAGPTWHWVARGLPGQTDFTLSNLPPAGAFYLAATTNDVDGNGLTAAYRELVGGPDTLTNDFDADGMPDWWEIKYSGTLNQSSSEDYDGDGVSNLDEYGGGTDPNSIAFLVQFPFQVTRFAAATGSVVVVSGVPVQMAVLVDRTNYSEASWGDFSTNLIVPLGSNQGWHDVWVGLKGRPAEAEQTWEWKRLNLDQTPPILAITSPTNTELTQPMIQLCGYSPDTLSSISCDLSNASGLFTNRMIFVLDRQFDTSVWAVTNSLFQAFDLDLVSGTNLVTIRAEDWAGNLTETNFSYTLVADTNPPVLTISWPPAGAQLVGGTFLVNGTVDDPTAKLTLSLQDTNGAISVFGALVERDGKYWVENLPLGDGTNALTLTATDVWGNTTVTNLSVVKNSVTATMNAVPQDQLGQQTVTVNGTVSDASYAVWVNGVPATVNSDGTWEANDVPVRPEGGTAIFDYTIYPPDEAPSTGGSGGSGASAYNPASPRAALGRRALVLFDGLYVESDMTQLAFEYSEAVTLFGWWGGWCTWDEVRRRGHNWTNAAPSVGWERIWVSRASSEPAGNGTLETSGTVTWPAATWPDLKSATWTVTSLQLSGWTFENPPVIGDEHCQVNIPRSGQWLTDSEAGAWSSSYLRFAQTKRKLFTGGRSIPKRNNLFLLSCPTFEVTNKYDLPVRNQQGQVGYLYLPHRPIPSQNVVLGAAGRLDADGYVWGVFPDGVTKDVTPTLTGADAGVDYFRFTPGCIKVYLTNCCHTPVPLPRDRTELGVGEEVDILLTNLPSPPPSIQWSATAGSLSRTSGADTVFTPPATAARPPSRPS